MSRILISIFLLLIVSLVPAKAQDSDEFLTQAPQASNFKELRLKSNVLPWALTIANIGAEVELARKWSASLELWYCPWKISDKFSVKTLAILPEGRWWLKSNQKGSFFNIHLTVVWFNVRTHSYRYQDRGRPLLGAGIGYGYRLNFNNRWGMEFEIGAGMANTKYDRFYNVENGALKDTRVSTYWGIDRASIAFTYYLCDL